MHINKNHENIVKNRGDRYNYILTYDKGDITIDKRKIIKYKSEYMRVKCPYCCKEYDVKVNGFRSGNNCSHCCNKYENSFAYYIQVELGESLNKYWDWEKNNVNPYCIYKRGDMEIWIKCIHTDYHSSYKTSCMRFYKRYGCPYCSHRGGKVHPKDSFAQYHIENTDPNFLEKYWSDKNILDPWEITPKSDKKVWIKCVNEEVNPVTGIMKMCYHEDYEISCYNFYKNSRCPYCNSNQGIRVNKWDSYGTLYPEKAKYWDYKRNKKSPFEITPFSKMKYWHICQKCGESFERSIQNINKYNCGVVCKNCNASQGEYTIIRYLDKNKINYVYDNEYFKDLRSEKGNVLRPDFIITELSLWIEYDGQQHFKYINGIHKSIEEFKCLQKNDKIKNQYAKEHGWKLIRIPYWDFENIEEILNRELMDLNNKLQPLITSHTMNGSQTTSNTVGRPSISEDDPNKATESQN